VRKNYVLIDFENVHPKNLEILKGHDFEVIVFIGAKQTKIALELAIAMQSFGNNAKYIQIEGNGPNALDFHIAFYIGEISAKNSGCYFHIISKDTGFDPLIKHLKTKKIYVQRKKDISEIPILKISNAVSLPERVRSIIDFLKSRGNSKPRTVKTLSNSISSLFMKKLGDEELTEIVEELIKQKIIVAKGPSVSYNLPV
jgi:hypothetical protein